MKKLTCLLTVFCLALMLTACGGKTDDSTGQQAAPAEAESKTEAPEEADDKGESEETDASADDQAQADQSVAASTEKDNNTEGEEAAETPEGAESDAKESEVKESDAKESDAEKSGAKESAAKDSSVNESAAGGSAAKGKLLYMGHSSIRITTPEEKVIYIDPYVGDGYEPAADLILVTHGHYDHYDLDKVANRNPDCQIITWQEAHTDGTYQTFDLDFASVEAVEAGNNQYHSLDECVGYIVTLTDGTSVYVTGDTSTTDQMSSLAEKEIDYAFFCCDGVYNMGLEEAAKCAEMVNAKHNIPYHMVPADSGNVFDRTVAEQFNAPNLLIIEDGQEIELE